MSDNLGRTVMCLFCAFHALTLSKKNTRNMNMLARLCVCCEKRPHINAHTTNRSSDTSQRIEGDYYFLRLPNKHKKMTHSTPETMTLHGIRMSQRLGWRIESMYRVACVLIVPLADQTFSAGTALCDARDGSLMLWRSAACTVLADVRCVDHTAACYITRMRWAVFCVFVLWSRRWRCFTHAGAFVFIVVFNSSA